MRPLAGSGVSRSMPAAASARLFTQAVWPSLEKNTAGLSDTTVSSIARLGGRSSLKAVGLQPAPLIQLRSVICSAHAATRSRYASGTASTSKRLQSSSSRPLMYGWMWASWKPGSTRPPGWERMRVPWPTMGSAVARSPTYRMRSPRTATASAQGRAGSSVYTRASRIRRSADTAAALTAAPSPALPVPSQPPARTANRARISAPRGARNLLRRWPPVVTIFMYTLPGDSMTFRVRGRAGGPFRHLPAQCRFPRL